MWEWYCPSGPLMVRYTPVPICLAVSPLQGGIMPLGKSSVISWRVRLLLSSFGRITGTWSISGRRSASTPGRPGGPFCLTSLTLPCLIAQDPGTSSRMPCLVSTLRRRIRRPRTPFSLSRHWSLLPDWRSWTRWRGLWRVRSLRPTHPLTGCTYQMRSGQWFLSGLILPPSPVTREFAVR